MMFNQLLTGTRVRFCATHLILFDLFGGSVGKTNLTQEQASIYKAIALLKKYVSSDSREVTNVTIVNSHNGRYTIHSSLFTGTDSIKLITNIIDMTGGKRDTIFNLEKRNFLFKLDRTSYPINSVRFAGHSQRISIEKNGLGETFETTDGRALMNLLEFGE